MSKGMSVGVLVLALATHASGAELPTLGLLGVDAGLPATISVATTAPSTSYADLESWPGGKLPQDSFIQIIGPVARQIAQETGVPASVQIAQAALETGWGSSTIGDSHNLFGMKHVGPAGSVLKQTTEYYDGPVCEIAAFRKYNTWTESMRDHARLFTGQDPHLISLGKGDIYVPALAFNHDPEQYTRAIGAAGYATDSQYADSLNEIINKYGLRAWDPWDDVAPAAPAPGIPTP